MNYKNLVFTFLMTINFMSHASDQKLHGFFTSHMIVGTLCCACFMGLKGVFHSSKARSYDNKIRTRHQDTNNDFKIWREKSEQRITNINRLPLPSELSAYIVATFDEYESAKPLGFNARYLTIANQIADENKKSRNAWLLSGALLMGSGLLISFTQPPQK